MTNGSANNIFTVTYDYICRVDTLSLNAANDIGNVDYIQNSGWEYYPSSHTQSQAGCPLSVILEYLDEDTSQWFSFSANSDISGRLTLDTTGAIFGRVGVESGGIPGNGKRYFKQMRTTYTSTDSFDSAKILEDYWTVTIRKSCESYILTKTGEIPDFAISDDGTTGQVIAGSHFSWSSPDTFDICRLTTSIYQFVNNDWVSYSLDVPAGETFLTNYN